MQKPKYRFKDYFLIPCRYAFPHTVGILLCYLIGAVYPGLFILISGNFIDKVIAFFGEREGRSGLAQAVLLLILLLAIKYLAQSAGVFLKNGLALKLSEEIDIRVLERQAGIPYEELEKPDMQLLIKKIGETPSERIREGFSDLLHGADFLIRLGSILAVLMAKVPLAAALIMVMAIPIIRISLKCGEMDYEADEEADDALRVADYFAEVLTDRRNMEEREVFQYTEMLNGQWEQKEESAIVSTRKAVIYGVLHSNLSVILALTVQTAVMTILLFPVFSGMLTIGTYISTVKSVNDLIQKISLELMQTLRGLKKSALYMKDFDRLFQSGRECRAGGSYHFQTHAKEREGECREASQIKDVKEIRIKNLSFSYSGDGPKVLDSVSLTLEKGKKYAIVGENGAGKSTLIKILTGLYSRYEGEIEIDGIPLSQLSEESRFSCFSILYQDFAKYQLTAAENIRIGNIGNDRETENSKEKEGDRKKGIDTENGSVKEALQKSGIAEKIAELPKKENTFLGKLEKEGSDLSGGQWQKLAIARCIYKQAPVYIMDEPTSAADAVSEKAFADMFERMEGIVVAITHRLGIAGNADCIFVMGQGQVKESGTHEELMQKNGIYAKMYRTERGWYDGK